MHMAMKKSIAIDNEMMLIAGWVEKLSVLRVE
jgi:hypothetical protein